MTATQPRILFLAAPLPNCTLNASQSQPRPHSVAKLLPPQTQCVGRSDWLPAPVYRGFGPMTGLVTSCGPGGRVSCMHRDGGMRLRLRILTALMRPGPRAPDPRAGPAHRSLASHGCFIYISLSLLFHTSTPQMRKM